METPNIQMINGDCLVELPKIRDKSIDCILVDLPYGVLKNTNPLAKWDKEIPLDKLWEQWLRLRRNERTYTDYPICARAIYCEADYVAATAI